MTISASAIKTDFFTAIRALVIANKPTYTFNGSTITYNVEAEYGGENPTFPMVVVNSSKVKLVLLNLDGSGNDYALETQLDFYAKELHGKKAIEVGQQSLMATFIGNIETFNTTDGILPMEDFWEDSNIDTFQDKNQLLNTGSSLIRFKLK